MHLRIIKELKHFTHCDCTPEQQKHKAAKAEEMWWRNPQNKLQCESVQFSHQKLQPSYQLHACCVFTVHIEYLPAKYFCHDFYQYQHNIFNITNFVV